MTPAQIEQAARERYNSVGETFWSQSEIMTLIYEACMEIATETHCIEETYTTSTVADQQEYAKPTNSIGIKRITYAGNKLLKITFREDDALTLNNATTTATGTPQYYAEWGETIYLRPVPSGVGTLKVFSINEPQAVTSTSTLEVPSVFHLAMIDKVVGEMCAKDENMSAATYYLNRWEQKKVKAKALWRKMKRTDSFTAVQDEETLPTTILGAV